MAELNSTLIKGYLRVTNSVISNSETLNGHLYYSDVYHRISQEDGSTITRAGGGTISLPVGSGSKGIAILTDEGSDYGLLYVGSDGCTIHNSGDNGYLFTTVDKDAGTTMFGIGQSGTSSFFGGGLIINNGVLDLKNAYLRFQDSNGYEIGTIRTLQDSDHSNVYRPYYMYSDAVTDFIVLRNDLSSYVPKASSNRPGVTKLYRRDDNSDYSVQASWTGSYWLLQGYQGNSDSKHAGCKVDYADAAGSASTAGSASSASLTYYQDTRNTSPSPTDAAGYDGIRIDFKNKDYSGITSTGTWTAVVTLDGYSDASGGYPSQLGFSMSDLGADRRLYFRSPANASTWGAWKTLAFTSDIPSLSGYATQTWVQTNYLPLSGSNTITGNLTIKAPVAGQDAGRVYLQSSNGTEMGHLTSRVDSTTHNVIPVWGWTDADWDIVLRGDPVEKVKKYSGSTAANVPNPGNNALNFWSGTQAEYNSLSTKNANTLYIITG